jgi:hypothetical protein
MKPRDLNTVQRNKLVNLLCDCPSVEQQSTREAIVNQLPEAIRHGIQRHQATKVDVTYIVQRCLNYSNGLEALIRAVDFFESGSEPLQRVRDYLLRLDLEVRLDSEDELAGRGRPGDTAPTTQPAGPVRSRWALLVGINYYIEPAYATLSYCVKDVVAMEQRLKDLGYDVVCMHDELDPKSHRFPTHRNVEAELRRICKAAEHDDLILVHFACHGVLRSGQRSLIMYDTRDLIPSSFLSLADIETILRESRANRRILFLDACHVGLAMGRNLTDPAFIRNAFDLAEGFAVVAASTSQQLAQEWRDQAQGVFTYYMLEGLSGAADRAQKGFVTVDDLKNHVIDGLKRWNVQHGGLVQEPNARVEGIGDMIVADYRKE